MCACPKPEPRFPSSYAMVFVVFNEWRQYVVVPFVDISLNVDHHCLNFLLIKYHKKNVKYMVVKIFHLQTTKLQTKTLISLQTRHLFGKFLCCSRGTKSYFYTMRCSRGLISLKIKGINSATFVILKTKALKKSSNCLLLSH